MKFPTEKFIRFCQHLVIDSKESGLTPLRLLGTQRAFIEEIAKGLDNDIHKFVILKGRQLGISTVSLALDLFWQFMYPGLQGALVADKEKTRDQFKATLEGYLGALPRDFKLPVRIHNRNQLVLGNRSRLAYLVAGGRQSGALARGAGLNFLHATECSSWSDQEGLVSLQSSLAEKYPNRLYVFESTARGFNLFYDVWNDAVRARTTQAIFIGWWLNENYAWPKDSRIYKVYWDQVYTAEEKRWVRDIKKLYGFDIRPEQMAWWRWKLNEEVHDEKLMLQEFPPTEQYAFIMTGENFFSTDTLMQMKKDAENVPVSGYRYVIGPKFEDIEIHEVRDGELKVWEQPDPAGTYIVAADPAYGESEWADHFSIQVLRCYADQVVQVAEYNTAQGTMYGFAWVIAHLCGAYSSSAHPPTLILELGGPGRGVLQELQRMQAQYSAMLSSKEHATTAKAMLNIFGSMYNYLYRRVDSLNGNQLLQWETNYKTKPLMMHALRDAIERHILKVHSVNGKDSFVEEARFITQEGNTIAGAGRSKDDRVIAMALGVVAWAQQVQPLMLDRGETRQRTLNGAEPAPSALDRTVNNYMQALLKQGNMTVQ